MAVQPGFEFGRGAQTQELTKIKRIVERACLVIEHDVVTTGHAHDVVHARRAEQRENGVHIVLVGFGMIGIADIATHGKAEQLTAEMIFERGSQDLLAVVEVFGADEAHDRIDEQRFEMACDGISTGFARLLVHAVMSLRGESAPLPGFEVHDIVAERAAIQFERLCTGFAQDREIDTKGTIGCFGAGNGLEDEVDGSAPAHCFHLGGDVSKHTGLGGNFELFADVIEQAEQRDYGGNVVGDGIDSDDCVAAAVSETVDDAGGDTGWIVGGVIRLETRGEAAGESERVPEASDNADLGSDRDQVLRRMIFVTAAAISGVMPGTSDVRTLEFAASDKRKSRKSPTHIEAIGASAEESCSSRIRRVTSSFS